MDALARQLDQDSKRACIYRLLRLYRGRIVGVSSMLLLSPSVDHPNERIQSQSHPKSPSRI